MTNAKELSAALKRVADAMAKVSWFNTYQKQRCDIARQGRIANLKKELRHRIRNSNRLNNIQHHPDNGIMLNVTQNHTGAPRHDHVKTEMI